MNELLLQTLTEKSGQQEVRLDQLDQKIDEVKQRIDAVEDFKTTANSLKEELETARKQAWVLRSLFDGLLSAVNNLMDALSKPLPQKHHHHFPKILWVTIGLFLALTLAIILWVNTRHELARCRTADIKYRYLQLQHDERLLIWLHKVDSLGINNPDSLGKFVELEESSRQEASRLIEEAGRKEQEAAELRNRAKRR